MGKTVDNLPGQRPSGAGATMTEIVTKNICDGVVLATAQPCAKEAAPPPVVVYAEEPVHPTGRRRRGGWEPKKIEYAYFGVFVVAVVVIVVSVGLVFGLRDNSPKVVYLPREKPMTNPPTSAPTTERSKNEYVLLLDLPASTVSSINTFGSPQKHAYGWVRDHLEFADMPPWRKKQLFALTTFCIAVGRRSWLDPTKSECEWFPTSNSRGANQSDSKFETCNSEGEFRAFLLADEFPPSRRYRNLPPEIALLTALESIHMSHNNFHGNISDLLPSQLSELTELKKLDLSWNRLVGRVPELLGLLGSLEHLDLSNNGLAGQIPSELGLLTSLESLDLSSNPLTGSIPSELMALQTKHSLTEFLFGNTSLLFK